MTAAFTFCLDEKVVSSLDKIASKTDQSRDRLIEIAIEEYVALTVWQDDKIDTGLAAADRGDLATDDEVERVRRKYKQA